MFKDVAFVILIVIAAGIVGDIIGVHMVGPALGITNNNVWFVLGAVTSFTAGRVGWMLVNAYHKEQRSKAV